MYEIVYSDQAKNDLEKLKKESLKYFNNVRDLLVELREQPHTGTGKPEPFKGDKHGRWSRRITDKHRLVYEVNGKEILVLVISAYGHYDDK